MERRMSRAQAHLHPHLATPRMPTLTDRTVLKSEYLMPKTLVIQLLLMYRFNPLMMPPQWQTPFPTLPFRKMQISVPCPYHHFLTILTTTTHRS